MKQGTVIEVIKNRCLTIKLDDGSYTMFFIEFGMNKSLRLGDRCNVFYRHSILAGYVSYKATKIKLPSNVFQLRAV